MENIIEIKDLHKSFGDIKAVDGISFRVKPGELFAFLGVNGAGKSTTISIICGQLAKDSGTVIINGRADSAGVKRDLGVVYQSSVLDGPLSVLDNLKSRAALYGISGKAFKERLCELSSLLELEGLLKRPLNKLSGGQKRRIDIARALLHRPKILVLDEPTTGLDPQTRRILWNVVEGLRKKEGMTVFLTTHYMEEAADADYVVILDSGKIAAEGTPLQLKNTYSGDFISLYGVTKEQALSTGKSVETIKGGYRLSVTNIGEARELMESHPGLFDDFEITKGKMDDVFLAVTGKKLTGGGVND